MGGEGMRTRLSAGERRSRYPRRVGEPPFKHLLTVNEVSDLLGVRRETVRRWLREGRLPGVHLGAALHFRDGGSAAWRIPAEVIAQIMDQINASDDRM